MATEVPPLSAPGAASGAGSSSARFHIVWPHVVLGILGVGAGAYATYLHALVKAGKDTGCGISNSISCDKVIGSQYGEFFGIPLGLFGILFWGIVIVTAISSRGASLKNALYQRAAIATVGLGSSLVLAYISLGVLGKFCPVCATTHVLSGLNFLVAAWALWKTRAAQATR